MNSPRMIRPMMMFGAITIFLAVFFGMTNPSWRTNPVALLIIGVAIFAGLAAMGRDLAALRREVRDEKADDQDKPEP